IHLHSHRPVCFSSRPSMFFSKSSLFLHWSIIEIIFLEKDTGLTPLRHAIMIRWLSNGKVNSVSFFLSVYVYLTSPKSSSNSFLIFCLREYSIKNISCFVVGMQSIIPIRSLLCNTLPFSFMTAAKQIFLLTFKIDSHTLFKIMYCGDVSNKIASPELIHHQYIYPIERIFH